MRSEFLLWQFLQMIPTINLNDCKNSGFASVKSVTVAASAKIFGDKIGNQDSAY